MACQFLGVVPASQRMEKEVQSSTNFGHRCLAAPSLFGRPVDAIRGTSSWHGVAVGGDTEVVGFVEFVVHADPPAPSAPFAA